MQLGHARTAPKFTLSGRKRDVGSLTEEISETETCLIRLLSFKGEGGVFTLLCSERLHRGWQV